LANVTPIGNYLAGKTLLHRTDARIKLLLLSCYLTGLFLVRTWLGIAIYAVVLVITYNIGRVPVRLALRGLAPLVAILVFTILANGFGFSPMTVNVPPLSPWHALLDDSLEQAFIPLVSGFGFRAYGFMRGLFLALRITLLFSATSLLTFTSPMVALSDALVSLLHPLAALKVPTEDIAMVFSIALRFILLTANETERLMVAQSARGAVFDKGGPIKRGRAWLPVLIPLFVKLFRRADRLAAAMETRCYRGQGRTHLRSNQLKAQALTAGIAVSVLIIVVGVLF